MPTHPWRALAMLAILAPVPPLALASEGNIHGTRDVVVALIDTGVRATHREFDYRGPASQDDQLVAWWDFSDERAPFHRPGAGETWDPHVPEPYDVRGHGTATASMAVGANGDAFKTPSLCPGCRLAVAKVVRADGSISPDDTTAAIRWAAQEVGADVISISIGFSVAGTGALAGALVELDEAVVAAREAGALVVVAAGNGPRNQGGPGHFSWMQALGHSTASLIVGGAAGAGGTPDSARFSHDPEVVAQAVAVRVAGIASDDAYVTGSGTSFAAPLVAGAAARAVAAAADASCASPAYIEELLKGVARDTAMPPTVEGHGVIGAPEAERAEGLAARCGLPERATASEANRLHDDAAGALRWLASDGLDAEATTQWRLAGDAQNGLGLVSTSAGQGFVELEVWAVRLEPGERLVATLHPRFRPDTLHDLDLFLFPPGAADDGLLAGEERIATSAFAATAPEHVAHRASSAGYHLLVVAPFAAADDLRYEVDIAVEGSARAVFASEWWAAGSSYHG